MHAMALKRRTLLGLRLRLPGGSVAGYMADLLLWGAMVALIEMFQPIARGDGADLVALGALTFFGLAMARAARAGLLPATAAAGDALNRLGRGGIARLAPRFAVAFRPSEGVRPLRDQVLVGLIVGTAILLAAFTLTGNVIFERLLLLKTRVSYTLYLIPLAAIWAVLAGTLILGVMAANQWVQQMSVLPGRRVLGPRAMVIIGWLSGIVVLSMVPGIVAVGTVLATGWWRYAELGERVRTPYLFCRRDAQRRPRVLPVDVFLTRAYLALALLLALATAMGQTGRMLGTGLPSGPFALTQAFGQLATLSAILLLSRAASHLQRLTGGDQPPELPLTPTVWTGEAEPTDAPWRAAARARGFQVADGERPPHRGFDLLTTAAPHPQRFEPRPDASEEDLGWQVVRRFHVVMRRRFRKRMKHLIGAVRRTKSRGGSGYLFCPHVWLVRGLVRDADARNAGSGSIVGPGLVGPTYAQLFSPRLRRYLGGVLREMQVDLIFWEDAIRWADLKRVFGVIWETYDQKRGPLSRRHFVGLPRLRVMVQEEGVEADPMPAIPYPTPAPGHVRVLVITRDRGGEEEEVAPEVPSTGIREPSLVG